MKSRGILLAILLALPYTVFAAEPPTRIGLRVPDSVLSPGQRARLVIELLGEDGKPASAPQSFQVELAGIGELSQETRAAFPAGSSRIEVPIQAAKPGFWKIEASGPGLLSGFGVVACGARLKAAEKISVQEAPDGRSSNNAALRRVQGGVSQDGRLPRRLRRPQGRITTVRPRASPRWSFQNERSPPGFHGMQPDSENGKGAAAGATPRRR